eukprot:CAMPEP_0206297208 /NCGR_PEP_ID=MMETSP0106_2-20121207/6056_1 /ASSEMBLY_ACC=CAM_ASM_000206 /TAXON_ID=81532 /ORGANISM="Acanthoeca-like sp., Strain 10tr" /LENGTH=112 /DNA_ID=CAMNT_0053727871 /DNA_START=534 /DNA_END=871 /DNA_ORIENTATION=-
MWHFPLTPGSVSAAAIVCRDNSRASTCKASSPSRFTILYCRTLDLFLDIFPLGRTPGAVLGTVCGVSGVEQNSASGIVFLDTTRRDGAAAAAAAGAAAAPLGAAATATAAKG